MSIILDPRLFNFLIMGLYGFAVIRWAVAENFWAAFPSTRRESVMTIQPAQNLFELNTARPARYSVGVSVLVVVGLSVTGWALVGLAIILIF